MTNNALLFEVDDAVATLTFNRPEALNTLSPELRTAIVGAVERLEAATDIRCVVIRGAGSAFMAGGDVKDYYERVGQDREALRDELLARIQLLNKAILALRDLRLPVIASVHGAAAGAGLSLMMACDLAIAADDTVFTLAYSRIGASPDCSGSFFLPRLVGLKKAMEIALLGDRFDAEAARTLGIVNWVVPGDELETETRRLAARLASAPTMALAATKMLLNRSLGSSIEAQLDAEAASFAECSMSDDFAEGVRAFVEKRKPQFRGY